MKSVLIGCLAILALLGGCESTPRVPARVLFELPLPTDIQRRDDGTLDLEKYAFSDALLTSYVEGLATLSGGFAATGIAAFRFSRSIDGSVLPATLAASTDLSAPVQWINIDPDSSGYGTRLPFRWKLSQPDQEGEQLLTVRLADGFLMEEGTTYAVIATDRLQRADSSYVQASADFLTTLATAEPDGRLQRAWLAHAPLRDYIAAQGFSGVIGAAVVTVGNPRRTTQLGAAGIAARAAPEIKAVAVVADQAQHLQLEISFMSPVYQQGDAPFANPGEGLVATGDDGAPVVSKLETRTATLTLPKATMPVAGWPVVVFAHDVGGNRDSVLDLSTFDQLTAAGIATLSIDLPLHGSRAASGAELIDYQRPMIMVGNVMQAVLDTVALVRAAGEMTLTDAPGHLFDPPQRIDTTRMILWGHGLGARVATQVLAYQSFRAAILVDASVGPLNHVLFATDPIAPSMLFESTVEFDEFSVPGYFVEQLLASADASGAAAHWPLSSATNHALLIETLGNARHPNRGSEALAGILGAPQLGPIRREIGALELKAVAPAALPVSGNVNGPIGARTLGIVQVEDTADTSALIAGFISSALADPVPTISGQ